MITIFLSEQFNVPTLRFSSRVSACEAIRVEQA